MARKCEICQKTSRLNPEVTFHIFPANKPRKMMWFSLLNLNAKKVLKKRADIYICSDHFEVTDFEYRSDGAVILNREAVPKLFNGTIFDEEYLREGENSSDSVTVFETKDQKTAPDSIAMSKSSSQGDICLVDESKKRSEVLGYEQPQSASSEFRIVDVNLLTNNKESTAEVFDPKAEIKSENKMSGSSTDTASEPGDDIFVPLPIKEEPNTLKSDNSGLKSNSATDTASEKSDESIDQTTQKVRFSLPPDQLESTKSSKRHGQVTEEELIKMLEEEPPELTPELKFSVVAPKKRMCYLGDITIDDFKGYDAKQFYTYTKQKIIERRKDIRLLSQDNRRIEEKIKKLNKVIKFLRNASNKLDIDELTSMGLSELENNTDDKICSSEDDFLNSYSDNINDEDKDSENVDDPMYEENLTKFCNIDFANQVQVTFLEGNDDKKIKSLKRKLEYSADQDIKQSQKIFYLNNELFKTNKTIEELKSQLVSLRKEDAD